jgi:hypothetical protein
LILASGAASADTVFTEVGIEAGLDNLLYGNVSNHVGGACWIDFNNDTYPDLLLTNGQMRDSHLFENNDGDGTFTQVDELLPDLLPDHGEIAGCIFADYDNDGDSDIYLQKISHAFVLGQGEPALDGAENLLLKNLWVENGGATVPGQPLFQEVAASAEVDGVAYLEPNPNYLGRAAITGGWLDYDRDGCVDLYVGHMVYTEGGDPANLNTLYRNECDGTFVDATSAANPGTDETTLRPTLAFIAAHLDGDLWPDLFVLNSSNAAPYFEDFLYINNANGTFTEVLDASEDVGDDAANAMGVDVADIDLNGTWDAYIADTFLDLLGEPPPGNVLYLGNGDGTFQENLALARGVDADFSWGTNFLDADHDGDEDLIVGQTDYLYYTNTGVGSGFFEQLTTSMLEEDKVRGTAVADYDRDGDLDVVVTHRGTRVHLYRNDSTSIGNWLQIKLVGVESNRDAINAVVVITVNGETQMRQVKGGSSAHSQDDLVVHFGVGEAVTIDSVEVFWPHTDETVDELLNITANQRITITEGETASECLLPDSLELSELSVDSVELFEACTSITVGPAFSVLSSGDLTLRAGEVVTLNDGFSLLDGGSMAVEIDAP